MGSGSTADTHFNSALLRAGAALPNVLPGHSPPCYAGALSCITPQFSISRQRHSPPCYAVSQLCYAGTAQRRLPRPRREACSRGAKEGAGPAQRGALAWCEGDCKSRGRMVPVKRKGALTQGGERKQRANQSTGAVCTRSPGKGEGECRREEEESAYDMGNRATA